MESIIHREQYEYVVTEVTGNDAELVNWSNYQCFNLLALFRLSTKLLVVTAEYQMNHHFRVDPTIAINRWWYHQPGPFIPATSYRTKGN